MRGGERGDLLAIFGSSSGDESILRAGVSAGYRKGLPALVERRVLAKGESGLVGAGRATAVELVPGETVELAASLAGVIGIVGVGARCGVRRITGCLAAGRQARRSRLRGLVNST
jgi:hypothetical protein